jgi:hypothetical protein
VNITQIIVLAEKIFALFDDNQDFILNEFSILYLFVNAINSNLTKIEQDFETDYLHFLIELDSFDSTLTLRQFKKFLIFEKRLSLQATQKLLLDS